MRALLQVLILAMSVLARVFWNWEPALCRLLFCRNIYDRSEGRQWKMKKKMKNNKKERRWNAKSVSVRKLIMSSIILRSFKTRNPIFSEIMTRLSQPIQPLRFLKYGGRSFKMKTSSVYNKSEIPILYNETQLLDNNI